MFDFVPIDLYQNIYNFILLAVLFLVILYANTFKLNSAVNLLNVNLLCNALLVFSLLYIGFRPIHGRFIDMTTYNYEFEFFKYTDNPSDRIKSDYFFWYLTYYCSKVLTANQYFFMLACLYMVPLYVVSKKLFKKYGFYAFYLFIASFSFWAYGTNGMRNGIATSIFLLVFTTNKKGLQALILFIAIQFHSSMLIPTLAFLVAYFYKNPRHILIGWFICIPISLVAGGPIQALFAGLMEDDRTSYLTKEADASAFASTGFRWDFVLYSAAAIYAGWFYIFKKKFTDNTYRIIYGTYVIANAFWILVIKANFSNRFAYLSWFMMALVIIYPLLKQQLFKNQYMAIVYITLAYFGFTFLMNVIK
ncbi:EpsG family protein [Empedobacter falsenii]|uniref:EpsG family protein n=1 Tax=Empedobacter falsenii TaxID=343874 RepID=UPI001C5704E4|nr:EpsG family protein [Empedobacter falsenii]MBW1619746.1 EpsG family protein [Empedobacter falsenii]